MRTMWVVLLGLGVGVLTACEDEPCGRYVDYMCACHDGEPGFDCAELQQVYADADPSVQDQCAIDLADQQDEDDANGVSCEI